MPEDSGGDEALPKQAYEWHVNTKPKVPCAICGAAGYIRGQHRATTNDEGYTRRYLKRSRSDQGWKIRPAGPLWNHASKTAAVAETQPEGRDAAEAGTSRTSADLTMPLGTLFERFLRPDKLKEGSYATKYRTSLKWFRLFLEREPTLGDMASETLCRFFRYCLQNGRSVTTVRTFRSRLSSMQTYAVEKGLLSEACELPSVVGSPKPKIKTNGLPKIGSLEHYFAYTFTRSDLWQRSESSKKSYRTAIRLFGQFTRGETDINKLGTDNVAGFDRWLRIGGSSDSTARRYASHLRTILEHAGRIERRARGTVYNGDYASKAQQYPEGTLMHFLYDDYVYVRDISDEGLKYYRYTIRDFSKFLGHEATFEDLRKKDVNRYLVDCQKERHLAPSSVKGRRTNLLVIWRAGWDAELIDQQPRGIRKIKVRVASGMLGARRGGCRAARRR